MSATRPRPVLMIGIDASQASLVEQWMADGTMPNLARLRERGAYGPLGSTADWLVGSPWPSFYTSSWPSDHGLFNYLQWRPHLMKHDRPSDAWLQLRPFWRELSSDNIRTVAIDVPVTYPPPSFDGVEVGGWSTHDQWWPPATNPPSLLRELIHEFGDPPMPHGIIGLRRVGELLRLREQLIRSSRDAGDVALAFMKRYPWDLFIFVMGATHRGGHQFWDNTGLLGVPSGPDRSKFGETLRDIYVACDAEAGRLIGAAPESAHIMVFSLHGMGPNHSRHDLMPALLERILSGGGEPAVASGLRSTLRRVRRSIPVEWRSVIKNMLPQSAQDRLALFWMNEQPSDWSRTVAFTPMADLEGYVQINLRGREARGVVDPSEYEGLLRTVTDGLLSFVDEDTGRPIVDRVGRANELFPAGPHLGQLPDLLVRWVDSPAHTHRAIVSPRYGRVLWPTLGKIPDGRSGSHRGAGWLLAAGPGVRPGTTLTDAHILDLAPTVLALLGARQPYPMRGRSIDGLVA